LRQARQDLGVVAGEAAQQAGGLIAALLQIHAIGMVSVRPRSARLAVLGPGAGQLGSQFPLGDKARGDA
jgi:hypothetical protein